MTDPRMTDPREAQTSEAQIREVEVYNAVASVDDPEYPGISITDLGLVEEVTVNTSGDVSIGLVPTFSGCPALTLIAEDVRNAVSAVLGVGEVTVTWLRNPVWTVDRVSDAGKAALANDFTVAVTIGDNSPPCPLCGGATTRTSLFGPSRCRSVHRCLECNENLEVMRA